MQVVSDDERREVAERLRMSDVRDAAGFDCLLAEVVRGLDFCETPCEECHRSLLDELADLIDPDCGTAEASASPVPECDREALLELADAIEDGFSMPGVTDSQKTVLESINVELTKYARRIREACGEEVS